MSNTVYDASQVSGLGASDIASLPGQIDVTDSSANVKFVLSVLQAMAAAGKLGTVTLTDASAPALTLTPTQMASNAGALAKIGSAYTLTVNGTPTAAQAAASGLASHLSAALAVTDTGANVAKSLDGLRTLAAAGKLGTLSLSDGKLTLTSAQLLANGTATVLGQLDSRYLLTVTGTLTVAQLTGLNAGIASHLSKVAVKDTAINMIGSLDDLQTAKSANHLGSLTLATSKTPSLYVTAAQVTNDADTLKMMFGTAASGRPTLNVSGTSDADTVNLTGIYAPADISLSGNAATMSTSGGVTTFTGTPDAITLGTQAATVHFSMASSSVETIANFQFDQDVLDIALNGASLSDFVATDTRVDGRAAVALTIGGAIPDSAHGVVLTGFSTNAATLAASHLHLSGDSVNGYHAIIS